MVEFEKKIIYLHKYFPDLDTLNQIFLSDKILSNGLFEKYLVPMYREPNDTNSMWIGEFFLYTGSRLDR